jgi:hypothetical protein
MVRKQVYLEAAQDELLKREAQKAGRTEADIIRASLNLWLRTLDRRGAKGRIAEAPAAYVTERETSMTEEINTIIESVVREREEATRSEDMDAWAAEKAFMEMRSRIVVPEELKKGGRGWTRDELYEERMKKWQT